MGTPLAPTLAILFMSDLEESFLQTQEFVPYFFKRYIDDCFLIWLHGREKLDIFFENFNNYHPTIKFEMVVSTTEINFLDLNIYKPTNFDTLRTLATRTHF